MMVPNILSEEEVAEYKEDFYQLLAKNQHMSELHPRTGVEFLNMVRLHNR